MKTISLELSKKIHNTNILKNIDVEYYYIENVYGNFELSSEINQGTYNPKGKIIKTLTIDELIEIIIDDNNPFGIRIRKEEKNRYMATNGNITSYGDTLIESIEKILSYLIDNKYIK